MALAMATYLEPSDKKVKSAMYDRIPTIWWKFGENRFSRWVLFA